MAAVKSAHGTMAFLLSALAAGGCGERPRCGCARALDEVAFFETGTLSVAAASAGDVLYVAEGYDGVRVVDVRSPSSPRELALHDTYGYVGDVAVEGRFAYVADGPGGGLLVLDVTYPESPAEAGRLETDGDAPSLALEGGTLYLADNYEGLRIVDVSAPSSPREVGRYPGLVTEAAAEGDLLAVADNDDGFRVRLVDVSTRSLPVLLLTLENQTSAAVGLCLEEGLLLFGDGPDLVAVDVTEPAAPRILGRTAMPSAVTDVAFSGGCAYVATASDGLRVVDLSDPRSPRLCAAYTAQGLSHPSVAEPPGDLLFVGDRDRGLRLLSLE